MVTARHGYDLGLAATAIMLYVLVFGPTPPTDSSALRTIAGFSSPNSADRGSYVALRIDNPLSSLERPQPRGGDAFIPDFSASELGKTEFRPPPSFRNQQASINELMPEVEARDTDGILGLASRMDVGADAADPLSRALQSWGWLSKEVLADEWARQEDGVSEDLMDNLLDPENTADAAWEMGSWEMLSDDLTDSLMEEEPAGDESGSELSRELTGRLFGSGSAPDETGALERRSPPAVPEEGRYRPYR